MKLIFLATLMSLPTLAFGATKLEPCKDKPSCVISHKHLGKGRNYLEPIKYSEDKTTAHAKLMKILSSNKAVKITKNTPDHIHATFTSSLFKFVDDVDFTFEEEKLIHFRSNSRKGYYDFGANKDRIEKIRFTFHQSH